MTHNSITADAAVSAERVLQDRADRLVQANVQASLSSMVATLAAGWNVDRVNPAMDALHEQAQELCAGRLDYEEAARQAGWIVRDGEFWNGDDAGACKTPDEAGAWEDLCDEYQIEPYEWEVYEYWAVSTWLAEKLQEAGERVDTDFAGLNVWARTTTGQAISMDAVIRKIAVEIYAETAGA